MHNKQFIICKKKVTDNNFKHIQLFNDYILSYQEELNITVENDSVLLGYAFQGDPSREIPEEEIKSITSPIEVYDTWNGRWVLLYKNEIHPDACAQIGVFYGKIGDELIVSSSLALIAYIYKGKIIINDYMPLEYDLVLSWVPAPYTVIDGIYRLLPTQYLVINNEFEVCFRSPISKTDYSSLSPKEIYKKIYDNQRCVFKHIEKYDFHNHRYSDNNKNVFNIGLTAGYDSRMQAALMSKMDLKFKAHTFERRKSTEYADVNYPCMLAKILNIEWDYINIAKRQANRVIEYDKHTYDSVKDRDWKWHYTCGQYDKVDGDVIVSNSIWEAFCDYYVSFGSEASLSSTFEEKYKDLKKIYDTLDGNPLAEKSFRRYIEWVENNPIQGLSWADRITFEQLMGIWDGNENQGKDLFSGDRFMFNPGNSMEIFALVLGLPKDKRIGRLWEQEIANEFVPEFVSIPYNMPPKDSYVYYKLPYNDEIYYRDIVLYGAGIVGKSYYMQISSYKRCNIVAWVDKNYKEIRAKGINVKPVEEIRSLEFDFVLVAVESKDLYEEILRELDGIGIERDKVLWKKTEIITNRSTYQ